jgi:hypothetical protein
VSLVDAPEATREPDQMQIGGPRAPTSLSLAVNRHDYRHDDRENLSAGWDQMKFKWR